MRDLTNRVNNCMRVGIAVSLLGLKGCLTPLGDGNMLFPHFAPLKRFNREHQKKEEKLKRLEEERKKEQGRRMDYAVFDGYFRNYYC